MSRIKIFLLVSIVAVLGIIFAQNQQPIALNLLCADSSQSCLYQTPSLPLAVWIALFVLTGAIANLFIQALDRFGYRNSNQKSAILDEEIYSNGKDKKTKSNRDRKYSNTVGFDDSGSDDVKSYEAKQEPQNIEKSGSTYSYKYREAGDRPSERASHSQNSAEPEIKKSASSESNEEDWI